MQLVCVWSHQNILKTWVEMEPVNLAIYSQGSYTWVYGVFGSLQDALRSIMHDDDEEEFKLSRWVGTRFISLPFGSLCDIWIHPDSCVLNRCLVYEITETTTLSELQTATKDHDQSVLHRIGE